MIADRYIFKAQKILVWLGAISALVLMNGCSVYCSSTPPSAYIGTGTLVLPQNCIEKKFTGKWISKDNLLEGEYKDGIPVGRWNALYKNHAPRIFAYHDGQGNLSLISFYPDGITASVVKGRCSFENNKMNIVDFVQHCNFTPDGSIVDDGAIRYERATEISSSLQDVDIEAYFSDLRDQEFKIWIYILKKNVPTEKITMVCKLMQNNEIVIMSSITGLSALKTKPSVTMKNKTAVITMQVSGAAAPMNEIKIALDWRMFDGNFTNSKPLL